LAIVDVVRDDEEVSLSCRKFPKPFHYVITRSGNHAIAMPTTTTATAPATLLTRYETSQIPTTLAVLQECRQREKLPPLLVE
jgi:hypothetical protein